MRMSITQVTWEDIIHDWEHDPEKAKSFVYQLLLLAGITGNDPLIYSARDGIITITKGI